MSGIMEFYREVVYNRNEPRTSNWFLIAGPVPILMIIVTYVYFCLVAGPRYMRDKKPYQLRNAMIFYNFIQVVSSIYLVYEGAVSGWFTTYNYSCQHIEPAENPMAMRMARAVYFYFICKLIELLDTVFFVMRKKNRQISFLHIYHHALMPFCAWIGVRFYPGGHMTLLGIVNSFIHIIMYTYYMLSSFGPHMQKYLWWKKYLTLLQILQFGIIFVHTSQVFFNGCEISKIIAGLLMFNSGLFVYLFGSFYIKNYRDEQRNLTELRLNGRAGPATEVISNGRAKNKPE